jgi:hypothetical protein
MSRRRNPELSVNTSMAIVYIRRRMLAGPVTAATLLAARADGWIVADPLSSF